MNLDLPSTALVKFIIQAAMASQPNMTRLILLLGGNPDIVDLRSDQLTAPECQWLERSLERWIHSPTELFEFSLEKEEIDT
jgi:hypothetical protein